MVTAAGSRPRRFRIDLAYDGSDFSGWAAQPGQRTVEAEMVSVLTRRPPASGSPGRLVVAGRTDAGVHARGQVCHVDVTVEPGTESAGADEKWSPERVVRRWNRMLPPDVRVRGLVPAPPGFDARFSAVWRRYVYRIADPAAVTDPLTRSWVTAHHRTLDVAAMTTAAAGLTGRRDFAAFCRLKAGGTTIRTLHRLTVSRGPGGIVELIVVADAFCHSMVRALVGGLIPVGEGRRAVSWPASVLAAGLRDPAVGVAPPGGLVLEQVGYPPAEELAQRALQTRAVRDASEVDPLLAGPSPDQPMPAGAVPGVDAEDPGPA